MCNGLRTLGGQGRSAGYDRYRVTDGRYRCRRLPGKGRCDRPGIYGTARCWPVAGLLSMLTELSDRGNLVASAGCPPREQPTYLLIASHLVVARADKVICDTAEHFTWEYRYQ